MYTVVLKRVKQIFKEHVIALHYNYYSMNVIFIMIHVFNNISPCPFVHFFKKIFSLFHTNKKKIILVLGQLYVAARTEHKMTKCMDNARWPASAADRNGVGVLWYNIFGLGRLSDSVPMQVEFRKKDGIVQRCRFHRHTIAKCRYAGT